MMYLKPSKRLLMQRRLQLPSVTAILRAAAHDVTDSACSSTRTSIALDRNKQSTRNKKLPKARDVSVS